jgi:hypothetical protein
MWKSYWLIAAIAAFAMTALTACFEGPSDPYYYNHSYGYGGYSAYSPSPIAAWFAITIATIAVPLHDWDGYAHSRLLRASSRNLPWRGGVQGAG